MNPRVELTKRIYLAGPMRGIPEFNFPRFYAVAAALRANGHEVFNPAEKDIERHGGVNIGAGNMEGSIEKAKSTHGFSLRQALAMDLEYICLQANCIVLLPGWETSAGAKAEWHTALALKIEGVEIIYLSEEVCALMERAAELAE
jgi:Domain of unknown function (DUF4406)